MHIRTILNRFYRHPGFIYGMERWQNHEKREVVVIPLRPRARSKPICSGCHKEAPGYDTLKERLFQFVPFWGVLVFFAYAMRRVN